MAARRARSALLGYGLVAPSLFGVVCFLLLPMLVVVWLSMHRWDLLGPIGYVGLDNWKSVLGDPDFANSLLVTLAFIALVVPTQILLGLAAAVLLARGLPGTAMFRALYVIPWICSPLAVAVLWRWILAPTDGAVSTVLGRRIEWLTDPGLALPVVSAVTVWTRRWASTTSRSMPFPARKARTSCAIPCQLVTGPPLLAWKIPAGAPAASQAATHSQRSPVKVGRENLSATAASSRPARARSSV